MRSSRKTLRRLAALSLPPLLFLPACSGGGGSSANGSAQDFSLSGTVLAGSGTGSGVGTTGGTVGPLGCQLQIREPGETRSLDFESDTRGCQVSHGEEAPLARAGFSTQEIGLIHRAITLGPGNFAAFPTFTISGGCELATDGKPVNSVCVGLKPIP